MSQTPRWGMAFDLDRCTGCHACSVACKVENAVPLGSYRTMVYYFDKGTFPKVSRHFLPVVCQQCEEAPCLKACPTKSISRGSDGIVRINVQTCEGKGACETACPHGAIYVDELTGVADKCNFCEHRLAVGMEPACVETCPGETIIFGDLNDPLSKISRFHKANPGRLEVLKPGEGTRPQVRYKGLMRAMENKIPSGRNHSPLAYECENWTRLEASPEPQTRSSRPREG